MQEPKRSCLFQYVDLDEFLSENGVSMDGLGTHGPLGPLGSSHGVPKKERSPSPSDCMSPDTMNPPSPADSSKYRIDLILNFRKYCINSTLCLNANVY